MDPSLVIELLEKSVDRSKRSHVQHVYCAKVLSSTEWDYVETNIQEVFSMSSMEEREIIPPTIANIAAAQLRDRDLKKTINKIIDSDSHVLNIHSITPFCQADL